MDFVQSEFRMFVVPVDIFSVPDLSIHEQMTYIVIQSHSSARERTAFPSYETIAKEGRMSRRHAIRCVESLVTKGLLHKESQMRVTRHREIVQTSNLYRVKDPRGVVTPSHQGSDSQSPGVVTPSHQGSDSQSPKQDHLTDPRKNNKTTTRVVDDTVEVVAKALETELETSVKSLLKELTDWINTYSVDYLLERAKYARHYATKNRIGAFRKAVEEQWDINALSKTLTQSKNTRDERYSAFYDLYPDA